MKVDLQKAEMYSLKAYESGSTQLDPSGMVLIKQARSGAQPNNGNKDLSETGPLPALH